MIDVSTYNKLFKTIVRILGRLGADTRIANDRADAVPHQEWTYVLDSDLDLINRMLDASEFYKK